MTDKDKKLIEQYRELRNWLDSECPNVAPPLEPYYNSDLSHNFCELLRIRLDEITSLESKVGRESFKTAEDYFQSRNGGKLSEQMMADDESITPTYAVQLMEEYAEQQSDYITELFSKPLRELRPLQDLWRKENSPDEFIIPDATEFYKWIVGKVNAIRLQKPQRTAEEQFAKIKFEIAEIQFNNLTLNSDKTYIEANPSTHKIAQYVCDLLSNAQQLQKPLPTEEELNKQFPQIECPKTDVERESNLKNLLKYLGANWVINNYLK